MPVLFASDATQLSTHSGDHDCWPIYMSIGNLPSSIRAKPSTNAWILIAILPMPPKKDDSLEKDAWGKPRCSLTTEEKEKYKAYKDDVLHQVLEHILAPMKSAMEEGMLIDCADGQVRIAVPKLAGWVADYQEYSKIYQINKDGCAVCEVGYHQLGDGILGKPRDVVKHDRELTQYRACKEKLENLPLRTDLTAKNAAKEKRLLKRQLRVLEQSFKLRQAKKLDNVLWRSGVADVNAVWKPDILHTIYQGMLKHIISWLKLFLEYHDRYAQFNQVWLRVPAFQGLPEHRRALGANTQMTGKLLRDVLKCLLPCLLIALDSPVDTDEREQSVAFTECLACVRYFVDFALVCRYKFHTEDSIQYMEAYLAGFHRTKYVFAEFRTKKGKPKGVKRSKLQELAYLEKAVQEKAKRKHALSVQTAQLLKEFTTEEVMQFLNSHLDSQRAAHEDDDLEETAEDLNAAIEKLASMEGRSLITDEGMFIIPKLHLLSHFSSTIKEFGALQQFSTEVGETLHKGLKEAYRKSNKSNIIPQIAQYHTRQYAIRMRELNLLQLAKDDRYTSEIQDVLQLYADPRDKRFVAKMYRDGKSHTPAEDAFQPGNQINSQTVPGGREIQNESYDSDNDEEQNTAADIASKFPLRRPLFAELRDCVAERRFSSPVSSGCSRLGGIIEKYRMQTLLGATRAFLEADPRYLEKHISDMQLVRLSSSAWTALHITTPSIQTEEPFETLKMVCTGPQATTRKKPRNDAVLLIKDDPVAPDLVHVESGKGRKRKGSKRVKEAPPTDYGIYTVGNLKCLFKLKVPKPEFWEHHWIANSELPTDCYFDFRLAFVEVLQIVRGKCPFGEMIPGPEIATCKLPVGNSAEMALLKEHGGKVIEINRVERSAHLIPIHIDDSTPYTEKEWVHNNRIDMGSWDLIYGNVL